MTKGTSMKISLVIKVYERQKQQRKTKQGNKNKNSDDVDNKRFCQMILQNLIKISTEVYKL